MSTTAGGYTAALDPRYGSGCYRRTIVLRQAVPRASRRPWRTIRTPSRSASSTTASA